MKISCRLRAFGPLSVGNLRTLIMVSVNRTKKTHLAVTVYSIYIATRMFSLQDAFNM